MTKFSQVFRDQVPIHIAKIAGAARQHVSTPFSHLENGWTVCADILCMVRDPIAVRFSHAKGEGISVCVLLFRISRTAGRIALKYGVCWGPQAVRSTRARAVFLFTCSLTPFPNLGNGWTQRAEWCMFNGQLAMVTY